ncbi:CLUMA_CG012269, isoform A [Clunio marinus]|uniref:CLUMA_CG012269, isoform A n=1 Tax=Clunio marinus TaxID=568069 RepID=A0A1J1IEW4_9DIPT|nr:CLUMA_CG012269, isoform A [Clunio marinus]
MEEILETFKTSHKAENYWLRMEAENIGAIKSMINSFNKSKGINFYDFMKLNEHIKAAMKSERREMCFPLFATQNYSLNALLFGWKNASMTMWSTTNNM